MLEIFERTLGRKLKELHALRFQPYLLQQSVHRTDSDLCTVVALSKPTFSGRACDRTHTKCHIFKRVQQILAVRLSTARYLTHNHVDAVLGPLAREVPGLRNAVFTYVDRNIGNDGFCHFEQ